MCVLVQTLVFKGTLWSLQLLVLFNPSQQTLYVSLMGNFALHEAVIYLQTNILKDSSILKGQGSAFFTGAVPRTTPDTVLVT